MAEVGKRKHNSLPVDIKLEIIERLENGESRSAISRIYNIGRATISGILCKKEELLEFVAKLDDKSVKRRKSMKNAHDKKLDDAVFLWYKEKKRNGEHITGPVLCEMALHLNKQLGGSPDFKASSGWLHNFKSRHCIRGRENDCDILCMDTNVPKEKEHINIMGYSRDNVYVIVDIYLDGNFLNEFSPKNLNPLIVLACLNTSGKHRLPLLIVGNPDIADDIKSCYLDKFSFIPQQNPVVVDIKVFSEWYTNIFMTAVKNEQNSLGKFSKILLLLDNEPCLLYADVLNSVDENFKVAFTTFDSPVVFEPFNSESIKQIMNNNKESFKKLIISRLEKHKTSLAIKGAIICTIVDVWNDLFKDSICTAWEKLWSMHKCIKGELKRDVDVFSSSSNSMQHNGFVECQSESNDTMLNKTDFMTDTEDNFSEDTLSMLTPKMLLKVDDTIVNKKKHNYLPIETKLEIINRIEKGESRLSLAQFYDIGRTTIIDIWNKKDAFLKFAESLDDVTLKTRKTLRSAKLDDSKLDEAVFLWFTEKKYLGDIVSGHMLCQKAIELNKTLCGSLDFKASSGWLKNFKTRHTIKGSSDNLCLQDIKLLEIFKTKFNSLGLNDVSYDNVYSVSELIVNWKSLLNRSFPFVKENISTNISGDEMVMLVCSNITGTSKLPLFFVTNQETEKPSSNVHIAPPNSFTPTLNIDTFREWYTEKFIPYVENVKNAETSTVLLLFQNQLCSEISDIMNGIDSLFKVLFISRGYLKSLNLESDICDLFNEMHVDQINNLINQFTKEDCKDSYILENIISVLTSLWNSIDIRGMSPLIKLLDKIKEIESEPVQMPLKSNGCTTDANEQTSILSDSEAYDNLNSIIKWYQMQAESRTEDLLLLNRIKDLAASKIK